VRVLDFGIARIGQGKAAADACTTTLAGAPMGTPAFRAPEQARGRWDLVGPHSDLWSLGASMFTLLSGEFVHVEQTVAEMVSAAFTRSARSIAMAAPDLPRPIVDVVDRALVLERSRRWRCAVSMQAAVRRAYRDVFGDPLSKCISLDAKPAVRRRSTFAPVVACAPSRTTLLSPDRRQRQRRQLFAMAAVAALSVAVLGIRISASASPGAQRSGEVRTDRVVVLCHAIELGHARELHMPRPPAVSGLRGWPHSVAATPLRFAGLGG
jgi:serine/threonine protein kinase